jgi:hypothetical protein
MLNRPTPIDNPSGELARLRDDLIAFYRPVSSQERFAVERIALAQQSLRRAARLEDALFAAPDADLVTIMSGEAFKLFLRYQAQAQRSYRLAVDEFLFLRDNRSPAPAASATPPALKPQPVPAPAANPAFPPRPPAPAAAGNLALRL